MFSLSVYIRETNKTLYFYKIPQQNEFESILRRVGFEIDYSVIDKSHPFPKIQHSGIKGVDFSIARVRDSLKVVKTNGVDIIDFISRLKNSRGYSVRK